MSRNRPTPIGWGCLPLGIHTHQLFCHAFRRRLAIASLTPLAQKPASGPTRAGDATGPGLTMLFVRTSACDTHV